MSLGRTVRRSGAFNRLAEPHWADPLDTSHSKAKGGRWNAPGAYGVLYLNASEHTARVQVHHKLRGQPFDVEDLDPAEQHDLVEVTVAPCDPLDCVSADGLAAVGLPAGYPKDAAGARVPHPECQPIGAAARADGMPGVECRSAATGATSSDEELALFDEAAGGLVQARNRRPFSEWYLGER